MNFPKRGTAPFPTVFRDAEELGGEPGRVGKLRCPSFRFSRRRCSQMSPKRTRAQVVPKCPPKSVPKIGWGYLNFEDKIDLENIFSFLTGTVLVEVANGS